ncbi:MAG: hypothetical protein K0S47_1676 [Herbinix sp.]|jgi:aspartyl/asparaginyl-tRNA synthetase|nr:hypothetical protein [Herbinix sp.]
MHKFIKTLIFLLLTISTYPVAAKAEEVTKINDLIENAKELDKQEVVIQGEAIGESMSRGDYFWINVNDGSNAIGIWISKEEVDKISFYGNYKNNGDTVKCIGEFRRACKDHGGEADFHVKSLEIVERGHPKDLPISIPKTIISANLTIAALLLFVVFLKIKVNRS